MGDLAARGRGQGRAGAERRRAGQRPGDRRAAAGAGGRRPDRAADSGCCLAAAARAARHRRGRCRPGSPRRWPSRSARSCRAPGARTGHPGPDAPGLGRPPAGAVRLLVRVLPALHRRRSTRPAAGARHVRHRGRGAGPGRRDGLRRGLPAADPPDRRGQPQGPQQQCPVRRARATSARRGRSARPTAATTRSTPSSGTLADFDDVRGPGARAGHGGRARPGAAVRAGPPVGRRAPGVVHHPAGRDDRVRGEPAEEVPGHLPAQLRQRPGRAVRRGAAGRHCTGSSTGCGSSGWTTRTPSRRTSGTG